MDMSQWLKDSPPMQTSGGAGQAEGEGAMAEDCGAFPGVQPLGVFTCSLYFSSTLSRSPPNSHLFPLMLSHL